MLFELRIQNIIWRFKNDLIVIDTDPETAAVKANSKYVQRADAALKSLGTASIDVQLERGD
jgi:hypothetical protein